MASIAFEINARPWQREMMADPAPRIVNVVHRRAGKSTGLIWRALLRGLGLGGGGLPPAVKRPDPRVLYLLPLGVQFDRTGLWKQLVKAAKQIPGTQPMESTRSVHLSNGGTVQCGGADNPDVWRGGYADEAIIDEYDDVPADLVPLVIEPMLSDRMGTLVLSGTPKGKGLLERAWRKAGANADWSRRLLRWQDTGALTSDAIERLRREMTPEEFAQEYECSFEAPRAGSFYASALQDADAAGRITRVPYDPRLPAVSAWDLGLDDATAIWVAQTAPGGEVRALAYYEAADEALPHYAQWLLAREHVWREHLLPHDAEVRSIADKRSRSDVLRSLGVKPLRVLPASNVADGINAVRMLLPRCVFDRDGCATGLERLRSYGRDWDERLGTWRSTPRHDWASHGADAFRMLAIGIRGERPPDLDRWGQPVPPDRRGQVVREYDPTEW